MRRGIAITWPFQFLCGLLDDLIVGLDQWLLGGHVVADADQRLQHFCLLVGRQIDQFAAVVGPGFSRAVEDVEGLRIDDRSFPGGITVDDLLQIRGQRVVPFFADLDDDENGEWLVMATYLALS